MPFPALRPLAGLFLTLAPALSAQTATSMTATSMTAEASRAAAFQQVESAPTQILYLHNIANQNDANEILTALRNMMHAESRIFLIPSRNAIALRAAPDDVALAQHFLAELDRPRKLYKLTYTLTEVDGTSRIGVQHFDVVVLSGQKAILKQGNRVPVYTGSATGPQNPTQITYLDVGISLDAEIIQGGDHVTLKTKVERSGVADATTALGSQDPIIRQTLVEGEVNLEDGKPLLIGSADIVGSTRRIDIDVVARAIP